MAARSPYGKLTPFVSLTVAVPTAKEVEAKMLKQLLDDIKTLSDANPAGPSRRTSYPTMKEPGGRLYGGFRYERRTTPAWTTDSAIEDVENHIVLGIVGSELIGFYLSDQHLRGPVTAALTKAKAPTAPLAWLRPVSREIMSGAFLGDGETRTLWLSATHRRTALKADAKILSGPDLDYALDPFDDQSFYWSAARSNHRVLKAVVGLSPRSSRLWTRKAANMDEFVGQACTLLDRLAATTTPLATPFPYLATPLSTVDPTTVRDAFDLGIVPPDLSPNAQQNAQLVADATAIAGCSFSVKPIAGSSSLTVEVLLNGQTLGTCDVQVSISNKGETSISLGQVSDNGIDGAVFAMIQKYLLDGELAVIRYDSGHSIANGRVFALSTRRVDFEAYRFESFKKFDVTKEKPSALAKIGKEDSLFCWVRQNFKGWLACDDGSMEKADFIQLDRPNGRPRLSLIHVKGANSDKSTRGISVSAYEVVAAQAVKNLLWFDRQDLTKAIKDTTRQSNYFWDDGKPATKNGFLAALQGFGADYTRRVVVVQPHATAARIAAAKAGAEKLRLDQLHTILAGAQRTCGGLGAEFEVICSS